MTGPIFAQLLALLIVADADTQTIPAPYQGTWGARIGACTMGDSPDLVTIGPRRIDLYGAHGFLTLAQLNQVDDPPEFHGHFQFAGELRFWDEDIRLSLKGDVLTMAHIHGDPVEPGGQMLLRCPK
jgi:hypothetical protein